MKASLLLKIGLGVALLTSLAGLATNYNPDAGTSNDSTSPAFRPSVAPISPPPPSRFAPPASVSPPTPPSPPVTRVLPGSPPPTPPNIQGLPATTFGPPSVATPQPIRSY